MLTKLLMVAALSLPVAAVSTHGFADTPKASKSDLNRAKVAEPGKGGKSTEPGKSGRSPEAGKGGKSTEGHSKRGS